MITNKSRKAEIKDLQRLLLSVGLMEFTATSRSGTWGDETQDAVLRAYTHLGWDHPRKGRWISAAALAAIAAALHRHELDGQGASARTGYGVAGGGGSHAGGGGSHAGGGGTHAGGGGTHAGGGGTHAGGGGSHAG